MTAMQQIKASSYLSSILQAQPELESFVASSESVDYEAELQCCLAAVEALEPEMLADAERLKTELRCIKQRFSLLWSLATLNKALTFNRLGEFQSGFADATVCAALNGAWLAPRFHKLLGTKVTLPVCGVFVLGLGKLGGNDLNFSSDIDLIAFYDKALVPKPRMHDATYVLSQLLLMMSKTLTQVMNNGFVWRVDWRLRPFASLHALTMSTDVAVDFYHFQARPWHRLALIKARVSAGDADCGEAFMQRMQSFLWRKNLDYRALDDLAELKIKINLEHPELKGQRLAINDPLHVAEGFNVKLGFGGIREIEFLINALQLVWGGRNVSLRQTHTLSVLKALEATKHIQPTAAAQLLAAYMFLRNAENGIQMLGNEQAYHLPSNAQDQECLQQLMGFDSWADFCDTTIEHRKNVQHIFTAVFERTQPAEVDDKPRWIEQFDDLSEPAQKIVTLWRNGFACYGAMQSQLVELKPLARLLLDVILEAEVDVSNAVISVDEYFRRLPPGGQYFRLLQESPDLLNKILKPLLLSPPMATLITQSPHLIDRFLEDDRPFSVTHKVDDSSVFYTDDYETRLENLRRLTNEELYLLYTQFLNQQLTALDLERALSGLAECILQLCLRVTCDEMGLDKPPLAILGYGKLGMKMMMPNSDLDLVFLLNDDADLNLANKFAAKFQVVVNAQMREGRVYELDTRLRPSGQSGSATIRAESFAKHQYQRSQTWSHIALFPARFVTGDAAAGAAFNQIKPAVLGRARQHEQFLYDAQKMLARIQTQRVNQVKGDSFTCKLRSGGLMELEYFLACKAVVACQTDEKLASLPYGEAIAALLHDSKWPLLEALSWLNVLQLEVRLFGGEAGQTLSGLATPVRKHVLYALGADSVDEVIEKTVHYCSVVNQAIDEFFNEVDPKRLSEWREEPVFWSDDENTMA